MYPAISDFFKGTLDENLKSLTKPAGLIPAGVFLLLNILFLLPPLTSLNNPTAIWFMALPDLWKTVVLSTVLLVLAYLLLSLSSFTLQLMSGSAWIRSPIIAKILIYLQKEKVEELVKRINKAEEDSVEQMRLKMEWRTGFPWGKNYEDYIYPTALGNVLSAVSSHIWEYYGISMTPLWPHMQLVVAKDTELKQRIEDAKAGLDLILNLSLVLIVYAVEHALLRAGHWDGLGVPFLTLGLAYFVYRFVAVNRARTWGDAVQIAFDLHREELRTSLKIPPFKNIENERDVWIAVSNWLALDASKHDFLVSPPSPAMTVISSDNVKVVADASVIDECDPPTGWAPIVELSKGVSYTFLINNAEDKLTSEHPAPAEGAYLLVSDSRVLGLWVVPPIENKQDRKGVHITGTLVPPGATPADKLLWTIPNIPAHGSRVLQYKSLLHFHATVKPSSVHIAVDELDLVAIATSLYHIRMKNTGENPLNEMTLEIETQGISVGTGCKLTGILGRPDNPPIECNPVSPAAGKWRWDLKNLNIQQEQEFILSVR